MPVSWKGILIQYTGRLHRSYSGKKDVLIFDYADRGVPMLDRMLEKRLRAYRSIGYETSEHPPWGSPTGPVNTQAIPGPKLC